MVLTTYLVMLLAADIQFSRTALKTVSQTDELTRLPNRRAFRSTLKREHDRAQRHQRPFALLMIDADGLKPTNDQHGHAAGDRLLISIAEVLKTALRGTDNCARYGDDEFIALLPEADAFTALDAAERIRTGVANTSFDFNGQRVQCTVSIGIAAYPLDAGSLDELWSAADRALYRAKNQGRDRIILAHTNAASAAAAKSVDMTQASSESCIEKRVTCCGCVQQCGLRVRLHVGRVTDVRGDADHAAVKGSESSKWIIARCQSGRAEVKNSDPLTRLDPPG